MLTSTCLTSIKVKLKCTRIFVSQYLGSRRSRSNNCVQNMKSVGSRGSNGTLSWISAAQNHYQPRRKTPYSHTFNWSYNHATSPDSWNARQQIICANKSTTFAAAWTESTATRVAVLQTREPSMMCSTVNLKAGKAWSRVLNKFGFCLLHLDGHIHIWRHRGVHTLPASIRYRHTVTSPAWSVIVWSAITTHLYYCLFVTQVLQRISPLDFCFVNARGSFILVLRDTAF